MQPLVFSSSFQQDRNVQVGVFPKREEILIVLAAGSFVAHQDLGAAESKMGQGIFDLLRENSRVIEYLLESGSGFVAPAQRE